MVWLIAPPPFFFFKLLLVSSLLHCLVSDNKLGYGVWNLSCPAAAPGWTHSAALITRGVFKGGKLFRSLVAWATRRQREWQESKPEICMIFSATRRIPSWTTCHLPLSGNGCSRLSKNYLNLTRNRGSQRGPEFQSQLSPFWCGFPPDTRFRDLKSQQSRCIARLEESCTLGEFMTSNCMRVLLVDLMSALLWTGNLSRKYPLNNDSWGRFQPSGSTVMDVQWHMDRMSISRLVFWGWYPDWLNK